MKTSLKNIYAHCERWLIAVVLLSGELVTGSRADEPCASSSYPSVIITKPPNGRIYTFYPTVRIEATAFDTDGRIVQVQFFVTNEYAGRQLLATVTGPPYTNIWQGFKPFPGRFVLTAHAMDDCGLIATSAPVTFFSIQDNYPPIVILQSPTNDTVYRPGSRINLSAAVQTADGSERPVQFYDGTNFIGLADFVSFNPIPSDVLRWPNGYSFIWTNVPPGRHVISARTMDDGSQTGVSPSVTIAVADILLTNPRIDAALEFTFTASGVVPGAALVLLGSTNLTDWDIVQTNVPLASPVEIDVGPLTGFRYRFFRLQSDQ